MGFLEILTFSLVPQVRHGAAPTVPRSPWPRSRRAWLSPGRCSRFPRTTWYCCHPVTPMYRHLQTENCSAYMHLFIPRIVVRFHFASLLRFPCNEIQFNPLLSPLPSIPIPALIPNPFGVAFCRVVASCKVTSTNVAGSMNRHVSKTYRPLSGLLCTKHHHPVL